VSKGSNPLFTENSSNINIRSLGFPYCQKSTTSDGNKVEFGFVAPNDHGGCVFDEFFLINSEEAKWNEVWL
jgi:hypothetical protein